MTQRLPTAAAAASGVSAAGFSQGRSVPIPPTSTSSAGFRIMGDGSTFNHHAWRWPSSTAGSPTVNSLLTAARGPRGVLDQVLSSLALLGFILALVFNSSATSDGGATPRPNEGDSRVCFSAPRSDMARYPRLAHHPVRTPDFAVDALTIKLPSTMDGPLLVLLCNRSRPPPLLAIPGGYGEIGEAVDVTFYRELLEETGIDVPLWVGEESALGLPSAAARARGAEALHRRLNGVAVDGPDPVSLSKSKHLNIRLLGAYARPDRDKRRHTVSVIYLTLIPPLSKHHIVTPVGRDDVKHCQFWDMDSIIAAQSAAVSSGVGTLFAFDHASVLTDARECIRAELMRP